jgi:hypothetical protein
MPLTTRSRRMRRWRRRPRSRCRKPARPSATGWPRSSRTVAPFSSASARFPTASAQGEGPLAPAEVTSPALRPARLRAKGPYGSGSRPLTGWTAAAERGYRIRHLLAEGEIDEKQLLAGHAATAQVGPDGNRRVRHADDRVPRRFPVRRVRGGPVGLREAFPQGGGSASFAPPGPGDAPANGSPVQRARSGSGPGHAGPLGAPDGQLRTGQVPAPGGTTAGSTVRVWVNQAGDLAGPPMLRTKIANRTELAQGLAAGLFAAGLGAIGWRARRQLDQRRITA